MKHRVQRVNIYSDLHGMPRNFPWVGVLHCLMQHCGFVTTLWITCCSLVEGPRNGSGHFGGSEVYGTFQDMKAVSHISIAEPVKPCQKRRTPSRPMCESSISCAT